METSEEVVEFLRDAIEWKMIEDNLHPDEIADVMTFEDAGVMTWNKGLVLRFASSAEYQVQVLRSR
jgi:hypothetical protein